MTIADKLARIRGEIGDARLIAVSKGQDRGAVEAALDAGQRVFGENRVQEAKAKFAGLRGAYPDLELHLIGPLQTNKAAEAVALFDVIQTVDRARLADALAGAMHKVGRRPRLYVEVNIGGEAQKAGVAADGLDALLDHCRAAGLAMDGLMCVPPMGCGPVPYFEMLRELADRHALAQRSMGLSGDYKDAVACGATEVRVGTAIFGGRT